MEPQVINTLLLHFEGALGAIAMVLFYLLAVFLSALFLVKRRGQLPCFVVTPLLIALLSPVISLLLFLELQNDFLEKTVLILLVLSVISCAAMAISAFFLNKKRKIGLAIMFCLLMVVGIFVGRTLISSHFPNHCGHSTT